MVQHNIILGHKISKDGIQVDLTKIDLIKNLAIPTIVHNIRSFLGHAGFYRRFIKDFKKISRPLYDLLGKYTNFNFYKECEKIF